MLSHRDACIGMLHRGLGKLQHTSDEAITFDKNTRTAIYDSICHMFLDIFNNGVVFGPGLEPERRDRKILCLLQDAQGDL